ncbi:MAG: glycoside hydrolase family protein, partial [Pseudomonadota bacterium]
MMSQEYLSIQLMPLDPVVKQAFFDRNPGPNVLVDPEYHIWDRSVVRWIDGRYHAYYSRWLGEHNHWLIDSEVIHAVAETPEGPFKDTGVVLQRRNTDGWDLVDSHSQYALVVDDEILLYYQSVDLRGMFPPQTDSPLPADDWLYAPDNWLKIRDRKRLGLAVGATPAGPFERTREPVITPDGFNKIRTIVDNPAVVYHDGRYFMVLKSFDAHKRDHRVQVLAHSETRDGPFTFHPEPVYAEKDTEDATVWFDTESDHYYMVCHVRGGNDLAMFTSVNGFDWQPASQ